MIKIFSKRDGATAAMQQNFIKNRSDYGVRVADWRRSFCQRWIQALRPPAPDRGAAPRVVQLQTLPLSHWLWKESFHVTAQISIQTCTCSPHEALHTDTKQNQHSYIKSSCFCFYRLYAAISQFYVPWIGHREEQPPVTVPLTYLSRFPRLKSARLCCGLMSKALL